MPEILRRWPDSTIVCVASGPTLTADDLAQVRGRAPVVAVNDAIRLAPWADVLYSSDRGWWTFYDGMPGFLGFKVSIGWKVGDATSLWRRPSITVLRHTGTEGLERDPSGLRSGWHSGYAAINLAVHLGARRIVLLGYTGGSSRGKTHFFGRHPSGLQESSEANYTTFRRVYQTLVAPLAAAGVTVVNATPGTLITAFPCAPIAAALDPDFKSCDFKPTPAEAIGLGATKHEKEADLSTAEAQA